MIGIYQIVNTLNNKRYIGSSIDIHDRWIHHKNALKSGKHHSLKLQRSYNKNGEIFDFQIIEECIISELLIREQYYIDILDSYKNGYNSVPIAGNNLGMVHSPETKEKIRKSSIGNKNMLGKQHSEETKEKIRLKLKGRSLPNETRERMSISSKGRRVSEETKEKLRLVNIGKEISEESRNKMSISHIGIKQSEETIQKRVSKNKGQKRSKDIREKMSMSMTGIKKSPMSDEHKSKISSKLSKEIALISIDGEVIKTYNSIKECSIDLNIKPGGISEVLCGRLKTYKKYKFIYI